MPKVENNNAVFPLRLKLLLSERGDTITALARALGISRQAVSLYTDGTNIPNAEKLCAIADYFNVSTDWLLGRTETRSPDTNKRAVCNYLCLSDAAVDALTPLNEGGKLDGARHFFLDKLLSAPEFEGFMRQAFNYAKYRCILHGRSDDDELDIIYGNDGDEPYKIPATLGNLLDAFKLRLVEALTPLLDEAFENWYREAAAASGEKWGADNG